jgi:hypothetical protein
LFNLLTTGGTPAYNGAAKLAEAKAAFVGAIDDYTLASEKIRTDKAVTPGAEKLVAIEDRDLLAEAWWRQEAGKIKTALQGNTVYEMVDDRETWEVTESATGKKIQIEWHKRKSDGSVWSNYGEMTSFVGRPGSLEYTLLNGSDLTVRLSTNGYYYITGYGYVWFGAASSGAP